MHNLLSVSHHQSQSITHLHSTASIPSSSPSLSLSSLSSSCITSMIGKTISKTIDDYEGRKSTSLTTAARLADFLGSEMTRDKGINSRF